MADGSRYKGQFRRKTCLKDGIGQIIYKDGSLFEGAFSADDTLYGRIIFTSGYHYEGEMKLHRMHGQGTFKLGSKIVFEGEFKNGKQLSAGKDITDKIENFSINTKSTDA